MRVIETETETKRRREKKKNKGREREDTSTEKQSERSRERETKRESRSKNPANELTMFNNQLLSSLFYLLFTQVVVEWRSVHLSKRQPKLGWEQEHNNKTQHILIINNVVIFLHYLHYSAEDYQICIVLKSELSLYMRNIAVGVVFFNKTSAFSLIKTRCWILTSMIGRSSCALNINDIIL